MLKQSPDICKFFLRRKKDVNEGRKLKLLLRHHTISQLHLRQQASRLQLRHQQKASHQQKAILRQLCLPGGMTYPPNFWEGKEKSPIPRQVNCAFILILQTYSNTPILRLYLMQNVPKEKLIPQGVQCHTIHSSLLEQLLRYGSIK